MLIKLSELLFPFKFYCIETHSNATHTHILQINTKTFYDLMTFVQHSRAHQPSNNTTSTNKYQVVWSIEENTDLTSESKINIIHR